MRAIGYLIYGVNSPFVHRRDTQARAAAQEQAAASGSAEDEVGPLHAFGEDANTRSDEASRGRGSGKEEEAAKDVGSD